MSTDVITIPSAERVKELEVIESKIIELLKGMKLREIKYLLSGINGRCIYESTFLNEVESEPSVINGSMK